MSAEQSAHPPADAVRARELHRDSFIKLVREFAREAGITRPVTDEDVQAVLDWFDSDSDPDYRPLPDMEWDSPEFWAEIHRRNERNGPALSAKTVSEQLRLRWGECGK